MAGALFAIGQRRLLSLATSSKVKGIASLAFGTSSLSFIRTNRIGGKLSADFVTRPRS